MGARRSKDDAQSIQHRMRWLDESELVQQLRSGGEAPRGTAARVRGEALKAEAVHVAKFLDLAREELAGPVEPESMLVIERCLAGAKTVSSEFDRARIQSE